MIYIFGTMISIISAYIVNCINKYSRISNKEKRFWGCVFAIISFLPLTIIMGIRYNVGTDYMGYWRSYYYLNSSSSVEIGFQEVIKLLRKISENPRFFIAISSLFICGVFFKTAYRESINPAYSILLFVINMDYFASMNGIRQYISIMICLLSLPYIINKKWVKALVIISIACLFHQSAIVFFVLIIFYSLEISPLRGGIILGLVYFVFNNSIRNLIFPIIQKYTRFGGYFLITSHYFEGNIETGTFLIYLSFFLLLSYEYKSIKKSRELKLLYTAVFLGMLIILAGKILPRIISRMAWHMNSILAIYLPKAVGSLRRKNIRIFANLFIIICYTIVCVYCIAILGHHDVFPYQTYWD